MLCEVMCQGTSSIWFQISLLLGDRSEEDEWVRTDKPSRHVRPAKPEQILGAQAFGSSLFGILNFTLKQLLNHLKCSLMYGPSFPASDNKTHAKTWMECVEIKLNSASKILGYTSFVMKQKYAVTSGPVRKPTLILLFL